MQATESTYDGPKYRDSPLIDPKYKKVGELFTIRIIIANNIKNELKLPALKCVQEFLDSNPKIIDDYEQAIQELYKIMSDIYYYADIYQFMDEEEEEKEKG